MTPSWDSTRCSSWRTSMMPGCAPTICSGLHCTTSAKGSVGERGEGNPHVHPRLSSETNHLYGIPNIIHKKNATQKSATSFTLLNRGSLWEILNCCAWCLEARLAAFDDASITHPAFLPLFIFPVVCCYQHALENKVIPGFYFLVFSVLTGCSSDPKNQCISYL